MPFVESLRKLGFDVATASEHNLVGEKDDSRFLWVATSLGRTWISFDKFRDGDTSKSVLRQLRNRGGKLVQISGGPEQPILRAVGRFLIHYQQWSEKLEAEDGWVQLRDGRAFTTSDDPVGRWKDAGVLWRSRDALQIPHRVVSEEPHFYEYESTRRAERRSRRPRGARTRPIPPEQGDLNIPDELG